VICLPGRWRGVCAAPIGMLPPGGRQPDGDMLASPGRHAAALESLSEGLRAALLNGR
jgi:hypothetical protein